MGWREFVGRVRGQDWIDGMPALVVRDPTVASILARPKEPGGDLVAPCEKCQRPFEERIITTGGSAGDPAVWDAVQVAVDGWACPGCTAVRYPRRMSAETSTRYGQEGAAAARAKRWREAEWWFTRIIWSWPTYAAGYLDLAAALRERLAARFDTETAARHRVERRLQQAMSEAIEVVEREPGNPVAVVAAAYLAEAEDAALARVPDRALRALAALRKRDSLEAAVLARATEIQEYVESERWIFTDASDLLSPHLRLQDAQPRPIEPGAQRAACVAAVERLEAYYAAHPGHWQSIWMAAMGRAALDERDPAIRLWRAACKAHPDRSEIAREAGLAFLRSDLVVEAREVSREITVRFPTDATLWCNRAVTELLCGDLEEARRCIRESRRLDAADPIARALERRLSVLRPEGPLPRTLAELERPR